MRGICANLNTANTALHGVPSTTQRFKCLENSYNCSGYNNGAHDCFLQFLPPFY